jgi:uncharacterized protein (DUF362 family)
VIARSDNSKVYIISGVKGYPVDSPFHPGEYFPEYPFGPESIDSSPNLTYEATRNLFMTMGLDSANQGSPLWNPLGDLLRPGQTVLLKPNWVSHAVGGTSSSDPDILNVLITHTAVLRSIIDYVFLAVGSAGKIIIADAPLQGTRWDLLLERAQMPELLSFFAQKKVPLELIDLRLSSVETAPDGRFIIQRNNSGDPNGYVLVQVDDHSALCDLDRRSNGKYRVLDYPGSRMGQAHGKGHHRYLISKTVLSADAVINLPKLKTHLKTGMTAAMKNLVGINGNKAYLPHFRLGSPDEGGDDYHLTNFWRRLKSEYRYEAAKLPKWLRDPVKWLGNKLIQLSTPNNHKTGDECQQDPYLTSGGSWYGNDTAWRMVVDLNIALLYSDLDGVIQTLPQRRWLNIVDAINAGEGNGPLSPKAAFLGRLIGGFDPLMVDRVCAEMIGFDWRKIGYLREGPTFLLSTSSEIPSEIVLDGREILFDKIPITRLEASSGWRGHIEKRDFEKP